MNIKLTAFKKITIGDRGTFAFRLMRNITDAVS